MRDGNILSVSNLKADNIKKKIWKALSIYAVVLCVFGVCAGYYFYKEYELSKLIFNTRAKLTTLNRENHKLITENSISKKTQFILRNISMVRNSSFRSYTKEIEHAINDLAYHYNVSGPIIVRMHYPSKYTKGLLAHIRLDISINTYDDEAIIQFVESLIMNFKGFVKVQEMAISKNKEALFAMDNNDEPVTSKLIKCKLRLTWHVLVSNQTKEQQLDKTILIYPKRPSIDVEDIYRTSIWEGSLMLSEDHLKKINLLHESWEVK